MTEAVLAHRRRRGMDKWKTLTHAVLIFGTFIMLFPFVWMLLTSLKTNEESLRIPPTLFPEILNWENYSVVTGELPFGTLYINTLLMMFWRVVCATVFSSMAGFAFAKLRFPCKKLLFFIVLTQMMLPNQIYLIPQYQMLSRIRQLNSIFALVFPGLVSAFGTFFLRQFYLSLPNDLMEAAVIDGCNVGQAFVRILMPLTKDSADCPGNLYSAVRVFGHDVAADLQHEYEQDDAFRGTVFAEGTERYPVSDHDGRRDTGYGADDGDLPGIPAAVY